jgi:hypothetical protein
VTQEHDWRECRPALLSTGPPGPDDHAIPMAAIWAQVPGEDRKLFHEFCCHNQIDEEHLAAMERIGALLLPYLGEDP